jgi:general stress protein CsbA
VIDCGVNILLWYSIMFNKHLKEELKCWNPDKITCKQFPVLSSFMTYHRVCNYINTTGVTSGAGTSNSSGPPEFIPGFQWGLLYSFYSLCVCFVDCFLSFCTFSFGHYVVPSSSYYGFWSPLWYLQTLIVLLSFFFWPLCCLFFFDLRILITPLVSSNSYCPVILFLLAIVLSVLLRYTDSDWSFGIFKLFLQPTILDMDK